jgi:DNA-binding transcriptional regulator YiaG
MTTPTTTTTTQQEFLREAMAQLGMKRAAFCARLGCAERTLDKWLLPSTSKDFRNMNEMAWTLLREILAHEKLKESTGKKARG